MRLRCSTESSSFNQVGDTALMAAAGIGWMAATLSVNAPVPLLNSVKYCLDLGIDINAADIRGYNKQRRCRAAYLAIRHGDYLVAKVAKLTLEEQSRRQKPCR